MRIWRIWSHTWQTSSSKLDVHCVQLGLRSSCPSCSRQWVIRSLAQASPFSDDRRLQINPPPTNAPQHQPEAQPRSIPCSSQYYDVVLRQSCEQKKTSSPSRPTDPSNCILRSVIRLRHPEVAALHQASIWPYPWFSLPWIERVLSPQQYEPLRWMEGNYEEVGSVEHFANPYDHLQ